MLSLAPFVVATVTWRLVGTAIMKRLSGNTAFARRCGSMVFFLYRTFMYKYYLNGMEGRETAWT